MGEKILAVAASHEITERELTELIANYPPEQQVYLSDPQARGEVLEQLIGFYLFLKLAEEQKIKESREYRETLDKMKNELASHMAAKGVIDKVTADEAEAKAYYDKNPDQFQNEKFSDIKDQLTERLSQQKKRNVYFETVKKLEEKYGVERRG